MAVRFGDFVLDSPRRQLLRGSTPVHLTPKSFDLLASLIDRRPDAVGREDLERRIWGQTHVAETSLAGLVTELRTALGDNPRQPRFIRTVHGFGYAFCAEAAVAGSGALAAEGEICYRLAWEQREVALHPGENVIGRDREVAAWIDSSTVSRRHARIVISPEGAVLDDLGSRNGTFVQGRKVEKPTPLHDRDEIRLGSVVMTLRICAASATETEPGSS
jgi:DNA-binding winged helix-turn-helix (wHTH) protein